MSLLPQEVDGSSEYPDAAPMMVDASMPDAAAPAPTIQQQQQALPHKDQKAQPLVPQLRYQPVDEAIIGALAHAIRTHLQPGTWYARAKLVSNRSKPKPAAAAVLAACLDAVRQSSKSKDAVQVIRTRLNSMQANADGVPLANAAGVCFRRVPHRTKFQYQYMLALQPANEPVVVKQEQAPPLPANDGVEEDAQRAEPDGQGDGPEAQPMEEEQEDGDAAPAAEGDDDADDNNGDDLGGHASAAEEDEGDDEDEGDATADEDDDNDHADDDSSSDSSSDDDSDDDADQKEEHIERFEDLPGKLALRDLRKLWLGGFGPHKGDKRWWRRLSYKHLPTLRAQMKRLKAANNDQPVDDSVWRALIAEGKKSVYSKRRARDNDVCNNGAELSEGLRRAIDAKDLTEHEVVAMLKGPMQRNGATIAARRARERAQKAVAAAVAAAAAAAAANVQPQQRQEAALLPNDDSMAGDDDDRGGGDAGMLLPPPPPQQPQQARADGDDKRPAALKDHGCTVGFDAADFAAKTRALESQRKFHDQQPADSKKRKRVSWAPSCSSSSMDDDDASGHAAKRPRVASA